VPTWTGLHTFNVGLQSNNAINATGTIRSTAQTVPASGQGTELIFTGTQGYVLAFDRTGNAWLPMNVGGSSVTISANGPSPAINLNGGLVNVNTGLVLGPGAVLNATDPASNVTGILSMDTGNPAILHMRNNQRGVGGPIYFETRGGTNYGMVLDASGRLSIGGGAVSQGVTLMINSVNQASPTATQVWLTNGTYSGYITCGTGQEGIALGGGTYFNGTNWIATATSGGLAGQFANLYSVQTFSGATVGNVISAFFTRLFISTTTGNVSIGSNTSPGYQCVITSVSNAQPNASQVQITNGTVSGYITAVNQDGMFISGGAYYNGSSWIASQSSSTLIALTYPNMMFYTATGLTVGSGFSYTARATLVASTGYFGIGTTAPQSPLHVNGLITNGNIPNPPSVGGGVLFYGIVSGGPYTMLLDSYGTPNAAYPGITFRAAGGAYGSPTGLPGGGIALGNIYFQGYTSGGSYSGNAGGIECSTYNALSSTDWSTQFYFYLCPPAQATSTNLIAYLQGNGTLNLGNSSYSGQFKIFSGTNGTAGIYTDTAAVIYTKYGTNYTAICDGAGTICVQLYSVQNFYRSGTHTIQNSAGTLSYCQFANTQNTFYQYTNISFAASNTVWLASFTNTTGTAGNLGIYVAAGGVASGSDNSTVLVGFYDSGASARVGFIARAGANTIVYTTTSDARLKTTIKDVSDRGLDDLMKIPIRDFRWNEDESGNVAQGIYAQELQPIYPEAVSTVPDIMNDTAFWSIDYGRLIPLSIRAIQQLADKVEDLETRVRRLELSQSPQIEARSS
jgi:hypothetical protein